MLRSVRSAGLAALLMLGGCRSDHEDARTVVVIIDSSPTNLDPRIGTDAQSERVGGLIFDALVRKDGHFEMKPWLAQSWEQPDPLTWVFHLRPGVRFHDGRPLEAEDVAWTINSLIGGALLSSKSGAFANVDRAEAHGPETVVVHMKAVDASLLFNLSDGLFGVVPRGADRDFGRHPVGSGAFRFVSSVQDKEVVVERNAEYWAGPPRIERVRFPVIPDAVTVALEIQKGSADIASNVLTLDMVSALQGTRGLRTETATGSPVMFMNFNVVQGPLKDKAVRQAIAFAMDRAAILHAIWRDQARLASSLLPPGHWAIADSNVMAQYPHDVKRAEALLEGAGYHADARGVRLKLEMKTSQDESTRLLSLVLQQQLAAVGIELTLRASEFGTFYADVTNGRFQMYCLRWIGSNEDPDIFRYAYGSDRFPPKGGNRGHYVNAHVDALLAAAATETDESLRRQQYVEVQKILADELPGIPLWYPNNEIVHTDRVIGVLPRVDGSFGFLRDASLR